MTNRRLLTIAILLFVLLVFKPLSAFPFEEEISVTGIRLDSYDLQIVIGQQEELRAVVYPLYATNQEVEWSSSDKDIVEINSVDLRAVLRALAPGEATITVTTVDGGFRVRCQVEVIVLVRSIGLQKDVIEMMPKEEQYIEAWVEPRNATDQRISWESSHPAVASVDEDGLIKAYQPGQARIIARSVENDKITAYAVVNVPGIVAQETDQEKSEDELASAPLEQPAGADQLNLKIVVLLVVLALALSSGILFFIYRKKKNTTLIVKAASSDHHPILIGVAGFHAGNKYPFGGQSLIIGRDPETTQILYPAENDQISRKHCLLTFNENNKTFTLEDLSSNGTYLMNGERLNKGKSYILNPGESFYLTDRSEIFQVNLEG